LAEFVEVVSSFDRFKVYVNMSFQDGLEELLDPASGAVAEARDSSPEYAFTRGQ
jgi:hypothetical protein